MACGMKVASVILVVSSLAYLSSSAMTLENKKANFITDLSEKAKCRNDASYEVRAPGRLGIAMNQYAVPGRYGYVLQYNLPYNNPYGYVQYRPPGQYGYGAPYQQPPVGQMGQPGQPGPMPPTTPPPAAFPFNLFGKKK